MSAPGWPPTWPEHWRGRVIAEVRGYRRTGHCIVNVTRADGRTRRYRVSFARWRRLRDWLIEHRGSGAWLRSTLNVVVLADSVKRPSA